MDHSALVLLVLLSPVNLSILGGCALIWRKMTIGRENKRIRQEMDRTQQELAALQQRHAQLAADHNDMLLGLETNVRRLDARLDHLTGIDAPAPEPARRPGAERQL